MLNDVTADELLSRLEAAPEREVMFRTPERTVRSGYHLTEFKLARVYSVDCGRQPHEWDEAIVELSDGAEGGENMRAGKMASILADVVARLPPLGRAPLVVEFGNGGLARYRIESIAPNGERLVVALDPLQGRCKAFDRELSECCTPSLRSPSDDACCSAARPC